MKPREQVCLASATTQIPRPVVSKTKVSSFYHPFLIPLHLATKYLFHYNTITGNHSEIDFTGSAFLYQCGFKLTVTSEQLSNS
ncbi:hypothetical protein ANANG_G00237630 [Anguilla anguilla]|uniref:Uncharacterized protein n=1 Tax=Anguilla anguilla TaxID=7936 RepID=A0A9D3RP47_ANGAN|nr:hypothetical protein ANANG_G00237630 [Anguilla anguilla]